MTTKWEGLWAQERQGFYAGKVIKKSEIPNYTRIVLRYNKFYEAGGNRPRFVYCFSASEGYESKCIPLDRSKADDGHYYDRDGNRLYTKEEVQRCIDGATADTQRGYTDNIISDYLY